MRKGKWIVIVVLIVFIIAGLALFAKYSLCPTNNIAVQSWLICK